MNKGISLASLMLAAIIVCTGCGGSGTTSPVGSKATVTVTFPMDSATTSSTAPLVLPAAVATQIGTGAWSAATLQNNILTLSLPSGTTTFGIAYACPSYQDPQTNTLTQNESVEEYSVQDGTTLNGFPCLSSTSTFTGNTPPPNTTVEALSVDASAFPTTAQIYFFGLGNGGSISGNTGTYSGAFSNGSSDLAIVAEDINSLPLAIKILRNQTVPGTLNGGNPIVFLASDAMRAEPLTVTNVAAGFSTPSPVMFYQTANIGFDVSSQSGTQYAVVPATEAQAGDIYSVSVFDTDSLNSQFLNVSRNLASAGGPVTVALPAPLNYAGPTAEAFPTFDLKYTGFVSGSIPAGTAQGYTAFIQWTAPTGTSGSLGIGATPNYMNGGSTLTVPDLTRIRGFIEAAASGQSVNWFAGVYVDTFQATAAAFQNAYAENVEAHGSYVEP